MNGITLTFNGFDFSSVLSTYHVNYERAFRKVMTALDGTEYFGNGTLRPVVTFALFPMTGAQAAQYYDALKVMTSNCLYTDTATGTPRMARMRVTSNLEYAFCHTFGNNLYYKGGTITLRGVECVA